MARIRTTISIGLLGSALLGIHLVGYGHGKNVPPEILTMKNPVENLEITRLRAKENYDQNCMMCHGEKGKGDGPMSAMIQQQPADLTDPKILADMTDGEIYWILTKGQNPMPPFETKLTDKERWGLVHLMRTLSNTRPNTTPKDHN